MRRFLRALLPAVVAGSLLAVTACAPGGNAGTGAANRDDRAETASGNTENGSSDALGSKTREGLDPASGDGIPPLAKPGEITQPNPFDRLYNADFSLPELSQLNNTIEPGDASSATAFTSLPQPNPAAGFGDAVTDPETGVKLFRSSNATATDPSSFRLRHEYSRRQAFNSDNTRFITQNERGEWYLHDANTFAPIKRLPQLAGDAEPLWSAKDPATLLFTTRAGGSVWQRLNTETDKTSRVFDFAGKTPWKAATSFWTHGEGTTSADGRVLTVVASSYSEATGERRVYGIVTVDLVKQRILGTLDAEDFPTPGAAPDHVSTSPSGGYAVVSWLAENGGTRAYRVDFSGSTQLAQSSEHSDLAFDKTGNDVYVYTDYQDGNIIAVTINSGKSIRLAPLYPEPGSSYAAHISGQAFDRPGWVIVSSYGAAADYGETALTARDGAYYHRVWLQELKPQGRSLVIASTQVDPQIPLPGSDSAYFLEPQATVSRDLSRVLFASNFGSPAIESYTAALPSWVTER